MFLDLVCKYFVEHRVYFYKENWPIVFFSGFGMRAIFVSWNELGGFTSLPIFWKSSWRVGTNSLWNNWCNSPVYLPDFGLFFVENFQMINSVSLLIISLLRLPIYSRVNFGNLRLSRNFPISSWLSLCCYTVVQIIFLYSFYFCNTDSDALSSFHTSVI